MDPAGVSRLEVQVLSLPSVRPVSSRTSTSPADWGQPALVPVDRILLRNILID